MSYFTRTIVTKRLMICQKSAVENNTNTCNRKLNQGRMNKTISLADFVKQLIKDRTLGVFKYVSKPVFPPISGARRTTLESEDGSNFMAGQLVYTLQSENRPGSYETCDLMTRYRVTGLFLSSSVRLSGLSSRLPYTKSLRRT